MVLKVLSYEKISYPMVLEVLSNGFSGVVLWKNKLSYGYPMVILWMLSCNRTLPPCFINAENMIHSLTSRSFNLKMYRETLSLMLNHTKCSLCQSTVQYDLIWSPGFSWDSPFKAKPAWCLVLSLSAYSTIWAHSFSWDSSFKTLSMHDLLFSLFAYSSIWAPQFLSGDSPFNCMLSGSLSLSLRTVQYMRSQFLRIPDIKYIIL